MKTLLFVVVITCLDQLAISEEEYIFEVHTKVVNVMNVTSTVINIANISAILILSLETKNLMYTYNYNSFDVNNPAHSKIQNNWGTLVGLTITATTTILIQLMINLVYKYVVKEEYLYWKEIKR